MIETETIMARKPTSLYHVESAVVPMSALTAWQGLFRKAKPERGQDISAEALRRGAVKDEAPAKKTAGLQYAALGYPIPSAYRTHSPVGAKC